MQGAPRGLLGYPRPGHGEAILSRLPGHLHAAQQPLPFRRRRLFRHDLWLFIPNDLPGHRHRPSTFRELVIPIISSPANLSIPVFPPRLPAIDNNSSSSSSSTHTLLRLPTTPTPTPPQPPQPNPIINPTNPTATGRNQRHKNIQLQPRSRPGSDLRTTHLRLQGIRALPRRSTDALAPHETCGHHRTRRGG